MIEKVIDEEYGNPNMVSMDLSELAEEYMCLYGININLQRAIPMIADGLKPIIRRILYIMYKNYRNTKVKGSVAQGQVLTLSPHGDQGLGDVFARMAQKFSNNVPLLDTTDTGNSGNVTSGDDYAAPRYLSFNLAKFSKDVLFAEFDGKTNMIPTNDDSTMEPFLLPAKFPIILLNGNMGIGWTLSTDIPPYNLSEVADATIKLLKNPDAKIHLVPDSPTGCDIIETSPTSFVMQSTFELDNINYIITIKNTPYMRYLDDIDDKLRELQRSANPIPEILSADDESELIEGHLSYVLRCSPCNLYNVINKLFKRVPGFRSTLSTTNMTVVDNFQTKSYNIKQIILAWIKWRLQEKRNYFIREFVSTSTHLNMLRAKAFMLSPKNLEKTVKIFRSCKDKEDIIPSLVNAYPGKVSSSQANFVSELKMYQLVESEYLKTLEMIDEVEVKLKDIREKIEKPELIKDVIIEELKQIKKEYGTPRKSRILNKANDENMSIEFIQLMKDGSICFGETDNPEHLSSDIIPISGDVCLVDEIGRFLWVNPDAIDPGKPYTMTSLGKTLYGNCIFATSNKDANIILLTNKGRIKCIPVNKVPSNASKKPLIPIDGSDEYVVSVLEARNDSEDIMIFTKDGLGKRIQMSDLNIVSVDAFGQYILKDYDVAGMFKINPRKPLMIYVTELGRLRVNNMKYLVTQKKFGAPKQIIKLSERDTLLNVLCVDETDSISLYHADSRTSTVTISSIPVSTFSQEPTRPKHVPGVKVIRTTIL